MMESGIGDFVLDLDNVNLGERALRVTGQYQLAQGESTLSDCPRS